MNLKANHILVFLFSFLCPSMLYAQEHKIIDGVLDLRTYDFDKGKPIKLNGKWNFVYGEWLNAEELNSDKQKIYLTVPGVWNGALWNKQELKGQGIATYHLKILTNSTKKSLALKILSPSTAYKFYLNDEFKGGVGVIGKSKKETTPRNESKIIEFDNVSDTLNLVFHIANFHHRKGGIWKSMSLGEKHTVYNLKQNNFLITIFLIGVLFILALYHFFFFLLRLADLHSLYFSLFCMAVLLRTSVIGDVFLMNVFPSITWEFIIRIEYISFYVMVLFFSIYSHTLYPKQYAKYVINALIFVGCSATLFTLVSPALLHSHIIPYFQVITLVGAFYTVFVIIKAIIQGEQGAWVFMFGMVVILSTIINDLLYYNYIINTVELSALGLVIFFVGQAFLLATRFSYNFSQVEMLTDTLKDTNQNLESKVEERTLKINEQKEELEAQHQSLVKTTQGVTASINYAQRIQQSILPQLTVMQQSFEDMFIYFRPRDIVSGDFYWFTQTEDKLIVAVVDCTGHGIPGAFMSLIGNDLLNEIILLRKIYEPDEILMKLKKRISQVLKQENTGNKDGMDISLCVIDRHAKQGQPKLKFAGAYNPIIFFQNGELYQLKGDRIIIGGHHTIQKEQNFNTQTVILDTETTIYLFSDGYVDQFGGKDDKKFMIQQFRNLLQEIHQKPMLDQKSILESTMDNWKQGQLQIDDILVMGLKLKIPQ
jgi:serine phosphatase RsbU (regulator of sigma subunit)